MVLIRVSPEFFSIFTKFHCFTPKKIRKNVFAAISQHRLGLGSSNLVLMVLIRVSREIFPFLKKFTVLPRKNTEKREKRVCSHISTSAGVRKFKFGMNGAY